MPSSIDRNRNKLAAQRGEHIFRQQIARLLDPRRITRVEQHPRANIQRLLRSGDNHDLLGFAPHRTRRPQISANRSPQWLRTEWPTVVKRTDVRMPAVASHQLRPETKRKLVVRGLAEREGSQTSQPRLRLISSKPLRPARDGSPPGSTRIALTWLPPAMWLLLRQRAADKGPCARASLAISFCQQLRIGRQYRNSRQLQLQGQRSRGWHLLAGTQIALDDVSAKSIVNLPVQRNCGSAIGGDDRE